MEDILSSLQEVVVESPVDVITRQIQSLIADKRLQPGDKLPSERKLAERFGVGRTYVRDAIRKLEFYGVLRTHPQSGTVVSSLTYDDLKRIVNELLEAHKSLNHLSNQEKQALRDLLDAINLKIK
ncbi:MAG: GntR family transcriptional regulator [Prevotellaceae bacterium]|jgi:GntR family transcriptional repressor for pyruvate dehydrogenase complex|nr:GntR family transcriptional regulator [Prevotellaceae bacterium]